MMLRRDDRIKYSDTSFIGMLRNFGFLSLTLKSFGFYLALFISIFSYKIFIKQNDNELIKVTEFFSEYLSTISATLMGIIIAGLAIVLALSDGNIFRSLLKNKTLQNLLFPFWYVVFLWGVLTAIVVFLRLSYKLMEFDILTVVLSFIIFLFIYSLYGTISLIGNTIRIMLYLAQLIK